MQDIEIIRDKYGNIKYLIKTMAIGMEINTLLSEGIHIDICI